MKLRKKEMGLTVGTLTRSTRTRNQSIENKEPKDHKKQSGLGPKKTIIRKKTQNVIIALKSLRKAISTKNTVCGRNVVEQLKLNTLQLRNRPVPMKEITIVPVRIEKKQKPKVSPTAFNRKSKLGPGSGKKQKPNVSAAVNRQSKSGQKQKPSSTGPSSSSSSSATAIATSPKPSVLLEHNWSITDFPKLKNKVRSSEKLASGGFGTVYKDFSPRHSKAFALKVINHRKLELMSSQLSDVIAECTIHKTFDHENIVRLWGSFDVEGKQGLGGGPASVFVMELCMSDLFGYMHEENPFGCVGGPIIQQTMARNLKYIKQLVAAIEYLHVKMKYIHMDVKPENVLISFSDTVKLTDFGCLIKTNTLRHVHTKNNGGTTGYKPPEILHPNGGVKRFDSTADVWAIGCVTYQLVHPKHNHPVFKNVFQADTYDTPLTLANAVYDIESLQNPDSYKYKEVTNDKRIREFLQQTLRKDRKNRPTITMLKKSAWLLGGK